MVTRKGTWPILKYDLKGEHGWRATVFLDDETGNINVEFDGRKFFGHCWKGPLREFLVSTNVGYINDKFSYDLVRWCGEQARNNLFILLEKEFGHHNDWPSEIEELYESIDVDMSRDTFCTTIMSCSELIEKIEPWEHTFGELGANKNVIRFTGKFWEELVNYWKKELEDGV
jgi:hypothetical protein